MGHSYIFDEMSAQIFCSLKIGLFSSYCIVRVLTIFWIQVLYKTYDLQIFSPSLICIFSFVMVSFEVQMFLILMKSNLSVFSLMGHVLSICIEGHKEFSPVLF